MSCRSHNLHAMNYPGMTLLDLPVSILYLVLIYGAVLLIAKQRYSGTPFESRFYWGLSLKFFGCIAFALIYQFYYQGGDTFRYFGNASTLIRYFLTDPEVFFELMGRLQVPKTELGSYTGVTDTFSRPATYMVTRIGALLGLPAFGLYLPTALFFASFSFVGIWALYRVTCRLYPRFHDLTVWPLLYIPSCFFWGSAYMQESLVVGCLGLLVWSLYKMFLETGRSIVPFFVACLCLYVLLYVKEYVLLAFLPAAFLWIVFSLLRSLKAVWLRWLLSPVVVIVIVVVSVIGLSVLGSFSERYNVENVVRTAEITAKYLQRITKEQGGSLYTLGEFEFSITGMVRIVPSAIIVTLFRPWLWEVRNPVMLFSALEGCIFLGISLLIIVRAGPIQLLRMTLADPFLLACLLFSMTFAFAVGVATYNFGSLVRYKIPCLFFYGLWLSICWGNLKLREGLE